MKIRWLDAMSSAGVEQPLRGTKARRLSDVRKLSAETVAPRLPPSVSFK